MPPLQKQSNRVIYNSSQELSSQETESKKDQDPISNSSHRQAGRVLRDRIAPKSATALRGSERTSPERFKSERTRPMAAKQSQNEPISSEDEAEDSSPVRPTRAQTAISRRTRSKDGKSRKRTDTYSVSEESEEDPDMAPARNGIVDDDQGTAWDQGSYKTSQVVEDSQSLDSDRIQRSSGPADTGTQSRSETGQTGVQQGIDTPIPSSSESGSRDCTVVHPFVPSEPLQPSQDYGNLLKTSYTHAIIQIHQDESRANHFLAREELSKWISVCIPVLASIPLKVLEEVAGGNIANAIQSGRDTELNQLFSEESLWQQRANQPAPGIYIRTLVDNKGHAPSASQTQQIIRRARQYASREPEDDLPALDIDSAERHKTTVHDIRAGRQHYLSGKDGYRLKNRVTKLLAFCDAVEEKIKQIPVADRDRPMHPPLQYIGFAMCMADRWRQHDNEQSSSFLMSLMAVISRIVLKKGYRLWNWTICFLEKPSQAPYAEVVLTRIANGFSDTGGGFCIHPAGQNVHSAKLEKLSDENKRALWRDCRDFIQDHTPLKASLRRETERLREYKRTCFELPVVRNIQAEVETERAKLRKMLDGSVKRAYDEIVQREKFVEENRELLGTTYAHATSELQSDKRRFRRFFPDFSEWFPL